MPALAAGAAVGARLSASRGAEVLKLAPCVVLHSVQNLNSLGLIAVAGLS